MVGGGVFEVIQTSKVSVFSSLEPALNVDKDCHQWVHGPLVGHEQDVFASRAILTMILGFVLLCAVCDHEHVLVEGRSHRIRTWGGIGPPSSLSRICGRGRGALSL